MEFCYRGIRYSRPLQTLESTESDILARYRGNAYSVSYPDRVSVPQPSPVFKYRGVSYRHLADGSIGHVSPAEERALVPVAAAVACDELHRVHANNLYKRLQERIQAARSNGNEQLLATLDRESQDLVCFR